MIKDKVVTIKRDCRFERGWQVVEPFDVHVERKGQHENVFVDDLVRAITFATEIYLILTEPCLPSKVVEEIRWVNKYAKVHFAAKTEEVLSRYNFQCSKKIVDATISINYIAIDGRVVIAALIDEDILRTTNELGSAYFENSVDRSNMLNNLKTVIAANIDLPEEIENAIKGSEKQVYQLVHFSRFNAETVLQFYKEKKTLLCGNTRWTGIFGIDNCGQGYKLLRCGKYYFGTVNDNILAIMNDVYISKPQENELVGDDIPDEMMLADKTGVRQIELRDVMRVNRSVRAKTMEEFLRASFDASEVNDCSQYCEKAKHVEFVFTLKPPVLPDDAEESRIYDTCKAAMKEWGSISKGIFSEAINYLRSLGVNSDELSRLVHEGALFEQKMITAISGAQYADYYILINAIKQVEERYLRDEEGIYVAMFKESAAIEEKERYSKFDQEIGGYNRTIQEKERLIAEGIEVLKNRRRIESLQQKIKELQGTKEKFIKRGESNKKEEEFRKLCRHRIAGKNETTEVKQGSLRNIIDNGGDRQASMEEFAVKYIAGIHECMHKLLKAIYKLESIDIPTKYTLYDSKEGRYIVIDREEDFLETRDIQRKFNAVCVVRREK